MSIIAGEPVADAADDRRVVELLADLEPGPLAMMLLQGIDQTALDDMSRIAVAAAWERQQAWVAAQTQVALAGVVAEVSTTLTEVVEQQEWRAELVAASLRWSPRSAGNRLAMADRLVSELPATYAMLESGAISFRHAYVLTDAVGGLLPDEIAAVEARVLERAPGQTVAQFTSSVRRALIAVAPEVAEARHASAVRERGVRRVAYPDGMTALIAVLPAADAETVYLALDAQARGADETLPMNARRADALLAWAQHALADPHLPRKQGRRVELQVVVGIETLLGLADAPGELVGYGPITASAVCALAADAEWRRLVVDLVTGFLLDYGTAVYRPPQALRDYVIARDRCCRFPGCRRRSDSCDIDHVCPAGKPGGKTASCNCCTLCRRHHRMKTHGGWQLELHEDGAVTWTAPNGRQFHVDATGQLDSW